MRALISEFETKLCLEEIGWKYSFHFPILKKANGNILLILLLLLFTSFISFPFIFQFIAQFMNINFFFYICYLVCYTLFCIVTYNQVSNFHIMIEKNKVQRSMIMEETRKFHLTDFFLNNRTCLLDQKIVENNSMCISLLFLIHFIVSNLIQLFKKRKKTVS